MITFGLENSFGLILSDITVGHSDSQPIREDFPSGWANQEPRRWRPKSARVHGNWVYFFAIQIIIANIVAKGGWVGFFYIAGWWKVGYFISSLNSGKKWLCGFFSRVVFVTSLNLTKYILRRYNSSWSLTHDAITGPDYIGTRFRIALKIGQ